jgi:protein phosphatase
MIEIDKFTDIGVSRERNEDSYIYFRCRLDGEEIIIASVCDGMGGLDAGDYASKTLCDSFKREIVDKDFVRVDELKRAITTAIKNANRTIYKSKTKYGKQCGTTVSCVMLTNDKGYAWHVGDTRIIQVRDTDVSILTTDHTLVNEMVKRGKLTLEQARNHKKRNVLTKAVGVLKDVSIDMFEFDYKNTTLVLCSDGFWHGVSKSEYIDLRNHRVTLQTLFNKVIKRGETDNITALVLFA